ncbi:hypothetical protein N7456_012660 [Penicillium angulare]|uniref:Uncharacterized protein n=1 Tax=Penicillium angulare TaxID=116970 RepID=A0A9W9JVL9_9EURO|nr:hypothetical protein N7456_012660 [Penicillium angulare]
MVDIDQLLNSKYWFVVAMTFGASAALPMVTHTTPPYTRALAMAPERVHALVGCKELAGREANPVISRCTWAPCLLYSQDCRSEIADSIIQVKFRGDFISMPGKRPWITAMVENPTT